MNRILFILPLLGLLGCRSPHSKPVEMDYVYSNNAEETPQVSLYRARLMQQQGKFQAAMTQYRTIINTSGSEQDREQARLGLAKCSLKLGDFSAASALLSPLKVPPKSETDFEKMAIVGEAMLHLGQYKEAEIILEMAVEHINKPARTMPSWAAACCGNLGYAYLKNNKPDKAFLLYQRAAKLYAQQGNAIAARKAQQMADELESLLKQYLRKQNDTPNR